ncbi:MAG: ATP-dependent exonuclease [Tannerellaceae bacterium]|nr:ATP-dependent exonuclease [Tannerellaceae bacterium]
MKVLAICGRNLASLEGDFSIDFTVEPLVSTGIFAISGPTGAGKSTILDAMCLALFARTPRTNQAKENNVRVRDVDDQVLMQSDPRFLLRRGTASGYAQVDFLAMNGHRYRSRWSVGRAREKESGRLQNVQQTLFDLDKEEEVQGRRSDIQARIIELIGLTFEQFTRSVLLAQNDFSTFLKAEQGEKASLLEKLTGTEHYSIISRAIFEKNSAAKAAYERCAFQVKDIELLTEDEETAVRNSLAEIAEVIRKLERDQSEKQTLLKEVQSTEIQLVTKGKEQQEAEGKLMQAQNLFRKASEEYEVSKKEQQQSEEYYQSIQQEIIRAGQLDVRIESETRVVAESAKGYHSLVWEQKELKTRFQQVADRLKEAQEKVTTCIQWLEKYSAKGKIAEQISLLLSHLDSAYQVHQMLVLSEKKLLSLQQQLAGSEEKTGKVRSLLNSRMKGLKEVEEKIDSLEKASAAIDIQAIEKQLTNTRVNRENLLLEQAQFVTTGNIKSLRDKLAKNMPCPVCGSLDHPYASRETNERILQLAKKITDCTLLLKSLTEETSRYQVLQKNVQEFRQKQFVLNGELSATQQELLRLDHQRKLIAEQIEYEKERFREQNERLQGILTQAGRVLGGDTWQVNWLRDPEGFRKKLVSFTKEWREKQESLRQMEKQQSGWFSEKESYQTFLNKLVSQVEEARQLHQQKAEGLRSLQEERKKLLGGRLVEEIEKEHRHKLDQLKQKLEQLQKIRADQSVILEQQRGISEQIRADLEKTREELILHQKKLAEWEQDFRKNSAGWTLEASLEKEIARRGEHQFQLRTQEENKKKVADLQEELTLLKNKSERWAKLNELAGSADGAKLRRIAQSYTLDVLLNYANVQLRNLTRRYRLERVPETLALQVIDRDMCDEIRTVHSLSGGESFLVSLALALGLSSLSSNRMKVESLFIDEGFGSLDSDTLRIAMDALESLRTQGRKIGVISHVQEITERIPTQIKVCRSSNGRSYIEIV